MDTILVTDDAGFVGSHISERLLARGDGVIRVDNFDPYYPPNIKYKNIKTTLTNKLFELVECDIREKDLLRKVFETRSIDSGIHLAALSRGLIWLFINLRS